jgi:CRISPR-associated protein Csy2
MKRILLIPHIQIQNANALSSPYTIGFPAMTAWLGAVHAFQRHLNQDGMPDLQFNSAAVVCHSFDLKTYKGRGDFVNSIVGTGNPLDKNGNRPSFIEEARCHLTISLVIEYQGLSVDDHDEALNKMNNTLHSRMKIAGGDILGFDNPELLKIDGTKELGGLRRRLMPGYVLIERRDLMKAAMEHEQDALDAMLDHLKIMHRSEEDEKGNVTWNSRRKEPGWIVPIATGFHGITELGQAKNQRDPDTPHRFAESIVTLGEFIMPYRVNDLNEILWHYHTDQENNLYICQQNMENN